MPKEIKDIKQYIEISRRADAKSVRIKKDPKTKVTKFKARCKANLYTLIVKDAEKAEKLKQSLAPNLKIEEISKKAPSKKR